MILFSYQTCLYKDTCGHIQGDSLNDSGLSVFFKGKSVHMTQEAINIVNVDVV